MLNPALPVAGLLVGVASVGLCHLAGTIAGTIAGSVSTSTAVAIVAAASLAVSAALTPGLGKAMRPVETECTSSPAGA